MCIIFRESTSIILNVPEKKGNANCNNEIRVDTILVTFQIAFQSLCTTR